MPYLPEQREYRNFAASNFKPVTRDDKLDEDGNPIDDDEQGYTVRGHFTIFDREYPLFEGCYETIDRHALDETDMSDVLFQFNHCGAVLARIRNKSLQVGIDPDGGWALADLGGCQQGRDTYEAIQNGLIDRMSFGFTIAEDGFEWDEDDEGNIHTRITKIAKIFDVSCVDLPASEFTDISARSYIRSAVDAKREQERIEQEQALAAQEAAQAEEEARMARESVARRKRRARALRLSQI